MSGLEDNYLLTCLLHRIEFGKTSADGQNECLLFTLAAAQLPALTQGQRLRAYDVGCEA